MASLIRDIRLRKIERQIEHKKERIRRSKLKDDAKEKALMDLERQLELAAEKYVNGSL